MTVLCIPMLWIPLMVVRNLKSIDSTAGATVAQIFRANYYKGAKDKAKTNWKAIFGVSFTKCKTLEATGKWIVFVWFACMRVYVLPFLWYTALQNSHCLFFDFYVSCGFQLNFFLVPPFSTKYNSLLHCCWCLTKQQVQEIYRAIIKPLLCFSLPF